MAYNNLTDFVQVLAKQGELKRITYPVKAELEVTEIADRVMKSNGPALLFDSRDSEEARTRLPISPAPRIPG